MNKHLQKLLQIIQQNNLDEKQKDEAIQSLKDADKELEITAFKLDRTEKVKHTTAILLEETIAELEQKRKSVESQNRELEIEAALERVRSRTLAMHHSDELSETAHVLFQQFVELGESPNRFFIGIVNDEAAYVEIWLTEWGGTIHNEGVKISIKKPSAFTPIYTAWKANQKSISVDIEDADLSTYNEFLKGAGLPLTGRESVSKLVNNVAFFSRGCLGVTATEALPTATLQLLERFAKVFEQAYTRFLDLQKAEAQAREAQIEVGVERVRAKALSMHKSEEIISVVKSLRQEMDSLQIPGVLSTTIYLAQEDGRIRFWDITTLEETEEGAHFAMDQYIRLQECPDFLWFQRMFRSKEKYLLVDQADDELIRSMQWIKEFINEEVATSMITFLKDNNITHLWHPRVLLEQGVMNIDFIQPPPAEVEPILIKMGAAFDLAHKRFLDLQKAEAQAREAQIEAALERVRASMMAMHHSEGLPEVMKTIHEQMISLGIKMDAATFSPMDDDKDLNFWSATNNQTYIKAVAPYIDHALFNQIYEAKVKRDDFIVINLTKEECADWWNHFFTKCNVGLLVSEHRKEYIRNTSGYASSVALGKTSTLNIVNYAGIPFSDDDNSILKRFAKVFDQSYTRFLDLQKAEAQARESKIETALERVRSRSLAMHNSSELSELVATLFDELIKLDLVLARCIIWILHEDGSARLWMANSENKQVANSYHINRIDHSYYNSIVNGWKERNEHWVYELKDAEKTSIDQILLFETELRQLPEEVKQGILTSAKTYVSGAFNKFGLIEASGPVHHTEEQLQILHRFNKVFEQSYTRFLDLQKAEAQAREAQIETALERVRSRMMAMHKSEELSDVISVISEQLQHLNVQFDNVSFGIHDDSDGYEFWISLAGRPQPYHIHVPAVVSTFVNKIKEARSSGTKFIQYTLSVEENRKYFEHVFKHNPNFLSPKTRETVLSHGWASSMALMPNIVLALNNINSIAYSDEDNKIIKRFGAVFEQSYTRFLDLKKAEAQAREAQIEAALERVRGKAMAMHSSEDLTATISAFYHELELFSITPRRCGVGLLDKETHMAELSTMNTTEQGESIEVIGRIKMVGHPVLEGVFDNWLKQKEYHPVLRGREISEYYQLIRPQVAFPEYPNDVVQYGYFFFFVEGGVYAWTEKELSEDELKIYRKFTSVLSLTYKRYKDLRDAEAREQEAIMQAALDRVRADIASMRSTADLDRITPLIWKELTTLGIPFIRCGVFIMDEKDNRVHTYLSTPEGHAIAAYHTPLDNSGSLAGAIDHWRQQKVFVTHWVEADFQLQADILLKQGSISSRDQYLNTIPTAGFYLHFLPFKQGMLYVGSNESLPSEVLQLVQSLAEAFSVAYARYEDFTRLELAKQQIEKTLMDLKQTQSQLVQSEKMASLGELTAGIAHEIQNPLNFVNNFSEVSNELIDEMNEGLEKGEIEEARAIAKDVKQNLEKINYHGKRAGEIVRSMLQHSRSSSGQKELTDMNVLCDEYLRLAYHGLRAKDKTFNAKFETHLDPTLPKVNVVPQDFGRVILNLINNAFYVVSEKLKVESQKAGSGFEPTVTVSTKNLGDTIKISIKDNGSGIPDSIKEKIFQPFFTTKPTGQGTGLGLSLSYDIVKAHGGEFKVETKEGEGSEFIITLIV